MAAQVQSAGASRTLQRPNILLLYTDQQRLDSLGCYGSPFASTPHLDLLYNVIADTRYAAVRGELRHRLGVRLQQARFSARPRAARY